MFWLKNAISAGCNTAVTIQLDDFLQQLGQLAPSSRLCVAYSGGLDSSVLLHLLSRLQQQRPTLAIRAIYIHHGLSPNALVWQQHCARQCAKLQLPFSSYQLQLPNDSDQSLEELAREARYQQLQQALQQEECLLTAHHADDQAETVLLQLLRGAGLPGLAAMPAARQLGEHRLLRPLLSYTREQLYAYAQQHDLEWIEDESNTNTQFDRNYLRQQVMPLLKARWPALASTLSRSAQHLAQAQQLLHLQAEQDCAPLIGSGGQLCLQGLLRLPFAHQQAAVRHWIARRGLRLPSTQQLHQIFSVLIPARQDAQPSVRLGAWQVRRFRHALYLQALVPARTATQYHWDVQQPLVLEQGVGTLHATKILGGGLRLESEQPAYVVRFRRGGERIKPAGAACTYPLKKLLQAAGVPTWQRDFIPLIYQGDTLVMVVGYWISAAHVAAPEQWGCEITLQ